MIGSSPVTLLALNLARQSYARETRLSDDQAMRPLGWCMIQSVGHFTRVK